MTPRQLALVSAVTKSGELKRRLIDATRATEPTSVVRVGDVFARLGGVIGSGLVGVVHAAEVIVGVGADPGVGATGLAVKRARAPLAFFREALRVERAVAERLGRDRALQPAKIVAFGEHFLAKERIAGPTLAELLVRGGLSARQTSALEAVLDVTRHALEAWDVVLDISPKNLAWEDGWVLLDAGPKLRLGEMVRMLEARSLDAYVHAYRAKLASGPSAPSVVSAPRSAEERLASPERHVFVRELERWFPLDPSVDGAGAAALRIRTDESAPCDEIVAEVDREGEVTWSDDATTEERAAALESIPTRARSVHRSPRRRWPDTPVPTLVVRPYRHWRVLADPDSGHHPLDLFCHELLPAPEAAASADPGLAVRLSTPAGAFADLTAWHAPGGDRAYVLVPGFRAGHDATRPLARALAAGGHRGTFASAYLGVTNSDGRALVTAGEWETCLLRHVVDHARSAFDARRVTLIAASHGAAAAMRVAMDHPAVTELVVDSPLAVPLELLFHVAALRRLDPADITAELVRHHLPSRREIFSLPNRPGLRVLALRPTPDPITAICGFPAGDARVVEYAGPHAATMRHDIAERGVPSGCLDAIHEFLRSRVDPSELR